MRLLMVVMLLSCLSSLSAYQVLSNALGQDLGPSRNEEPSYVLEVEGDKRTLLFEGKPIRQTTVDGGKVTMTDLEKGTSTVKTYSGKQLMGEKEGKKETTYVYDGDGRLERINVSLDGSLESMTFFCHDASTGRLSSVVETGTIRAFGPDGSFNLADEKDSFHYGKIGNMYVKEGDANSPFVSDENGLLTTTRIEKGNTVKESFDNDGNVVVRTTTDAKGKVTRNSYVYEKGQVVEETATDALGTETTTAYKDGDIVSVSMVRDGILRSFMEYGLEGKMETVYDNGNPYAIVVYEGNTKKVKEVRYL